MGTKFTAVLVSGLLLAAIACSKSAPPREEEPAVEGDRVIDLDPGRAFGTGGHATTRLVIGIAEEIADHPVERFLDLGSLAINRSRSSSPRTQLVPECTVASNPL